MADVGVGINRYKNFSTIFIPDINNGIDSRYLQQGPILQTPLKAISLNIKKLDTLHVLQSNQYSIHVKEEIAKSVIYEDIDPSLAMYLQHGLMDGTDFDDDDFV